MPDAETGNELRTVGVLHGVPQHHRAEHHGVEDISEEYGEMTEDQHLVTLARVKES